MQKLKSSYFSAFLLFTYLILPGVTTTIFSTYTLQDVDPNNVIPGTLNLKFNFRFSTASTADGLTQHVEDLLKRHGLEYSLEWTLGAKPFITPDGPLADAARCAIKTVTGIETELSTTGGTSDARFIAEIAEQIIELGPVNASIHMIDEHIDIEALPQLANIYQQIFVQLLK